MTYKLNLKSRVHINLAEAIEYYQSKRKGLGLKFLKCTQKFFDRITKNPFHYPLKSNQFREAYIQKFPYVIIYEIIDDENSGLRCFQHSSKSKEEALNFLKILNEENRYLHHRKFKNCSQSTDSF